MFYLKSKALKSEVLGSLAQFLFRCGTPFWGGGDPLLEKIGDWCGMRVPYASFGQFGRLGMTFFIGMMFCPYKSLSFLL